MCWRIVLWSFLGWLCCLQPSLFAATNQLRFAVAQAPINLDPRYASDAASERVNRLLYQRLVEFDASYQPTPSLATWQQLSPQHYRFTLITKPAPFHHGRALSPYDVKATYDSLLALKDAPHAQEFKHITKIKVLDNEHFEVRLNTPDKHFPAKLIIGILPADLIAKGHDFAHHPVGSGAFSFVDWQHDLRLKRQSDGLQVRFIEVKDPTVRVLKLLRREVEFLQGDLPPELVKYMQTKPAIKVQTRVGTNFSYLGLNMQDPVFSSLKVRQAIAHAIDRPAIIKQVMVSHTRLADALLPPEHYAGNPKLPAYGYEPEKAKQLLKEAGVKLPLKLVYKTSTDAQRVRLATIMQAQMKHAGIALEIRSLDWGTFFQEVKQGQFQLFGLTWVGIKTPEIYSKVFGSAFWPPQGLNRGRYRDTHMDAFLAQEHWQAVTQYAHQQLPYIPLWYEGQFAAMQNNISGYGPQADGNWDALASVRIHSPNHE